MEERRSIYLILNAKIFLRQKASTDAWVVTWSSITGEVGRFKQQLKPEVDPDASGNNCLRNNRC